MNQTKTFALIITKKDGSTEHDFRRGTDLEKLRGQMQTMLDRAHAGNKAFASMADWEKFELREQ